jgi:hypothetical protein
MQANAAAEKLYGLFGNRRIAIQKKSGSPQERAHIGSDAARLSSNLSMCSEREES